MSPNHEDVGLLQSMGKHGGAGMLRCVRKRPAFCGVARAKGPWAADFPGREEGDSG